MSSDRAVLVPVFSDPDSPQTTARPDSAPVAVAFQPAPDVESDQAEEENP